MQTVLVFLLSLTIVLTGCDQMQPVTKPTVDPQNVDIFEETEGLNIMLNGEIVAFLHHDEVDVDGQIHVAVSADVVFVAVAIPSQDVHYHRDVGVVYLYRQQEIGGWTAHRKFRGRNGYARFGSSVHFAFLDGKEVLCIQASHSGPYGYEPETGNLLFDSRPPQ